MFHGGWVSETEAWIVRREEDDTVKTAVAAVASVKGLIEQKDRAEFADIDDKMANITVDDDSEDS